MIEQICANCGKHFQAFPSRPRKFCSHTCYVEYQRKNGKWKWGQGRKRADGWQGKLSLARKTLFAEGKLISPTLGIKRPDLAERNRQNAKYGPEAVQELFQEYRNYKGGLRGFGKAKGIHASYLRELFHLFIPSDDLDLVMESKKAQNKHYAIGRKFEWRVRDYYKSIGYWVLRSPRSAGPVDLVAIKKSEVLLIQCKTHGELSKKDRYELSNIANSIGAKAMLVWRGLQPRYPLQFECVNSAQIDLPKGSFILQSIAYDKLPHAEES